MHIAYARMGMGPRYQAPSVGLGMSARMVAAVVTGAHATANPGRATDRVDIGRLRTSCPLGGGSVRF
ncbi:hypothetical protein GCM10009682_54340 [Luedemannella flava]|uniref:Uncharacterized protein n=1 Tax=Luedemannella flava TaxID=349316 RepID=A0ABP4YRC4_9ACTN